MRTGPDLPLTIRAPSLTVAAGVVTTAVLCAVDVTRGRAWSAPVWVAVIVPTLLARVEARPEGLWVRNRWTRRLVPWPDVHGFRIEARPWPLFRSAVHVVLPRGRLLPIVATERATFGAKARARLQADFELLQDLTALHGGD